MKVKRLIALLKDFEPDAEIKIEKINPFHFVFYVWNGDKIESFTFKQGE
jgi:hypothetical protein